MVLGKPPRFPHRLRRGKGGMASGKDEAWRNRLSSDGEDKVSRDGKLRKDKPAIGLLDKF